MSLLCSRTSSRSPARKARPPNLNARVTIACPHGDCIDPDDVDSFDPLQLPTNQDNSDERLSEVITAINAVRDSIDNNETPQKIEELKAELLNELQSNKTALVNQLEENKASNNANADSNTELLLAKLQQIGDNTGGDGGGGSGSDKDYSDVLNALLENSDEVLCQLNSKRAECITEGTTTVNTNQAADNIMNGIQGSGIYTALSEFKDININVTSACPSSFRFQLHFLGTYTIDVCAVFEPVVPLIRALFIAFWGLVSFRALTDA